MRALALMILVVPLCGGCPGDAWEPSAAGTISLASDVDPADWTSLEIRWGADDWTWPGYSLSEATSDISFPYSYNFFTYTAAGGIRYRVWRLEAWLSNLDDAAREHTPRPGDPAASVSVDLDCRYCDTTILDLELVATD